MSGLDNTPMLDFVAPRTDDVCAVLICAGQAVATTGTAGVRAIEIKPALELGRGRAKTGGPIPRFETGDPHMSRAHALIRRVDAGTVVIRDLGSRNGITVNGTPMTGERN